MSEVIPQQIRQQGLLRFDFLLGCLPGKSAPSDIDQVIERNGYFLFIECKRPGQPIPRGQEILLDRLIALSPERVRVLTVYGNPPYEIEQYAWWRKPPQEATAQDVRSLVRRWFDWADQQERS